MLNHLIIKTDKELPGKEEAHCQDLKAKHVPALRSPFMKIRILSAYVVQRGILKRCNGERFSAWKPKNGTTQAKTQAKALMPLMGLPALLLYPKVGKTTPSSVSDLVHCPIVLSLKKGKKDSFSL